MKAGGLSRFWNDSGVNWIVIVAIINLLHKRRKQMSTATNKAIVSLYNEQVWNHGRLDLADVFLAEDVIEHSTPQIMKKANLFEPLNDTSKQIIDYFLRVVESNRGRREV
jgi:hypothetical protein